MYGNLNAGFTRNKDSVSHISFEQLTSNYGCTKFYKELWSGRRCNSRNSSCLVLRKKLLMAVRIICYLHNQIKLVANIKNQHQGSTEVSGKQSGKMIVHYRVRLNGFFICDSRRGF